MAKSKIVQKIMHLLGAMVNKTSQVCAGVSREGSFVVS